MTTHSEQRVVPGTEKGRSDRQHNDCNNKEGISQIWNGTHSVKGKRVLKKSCKLNLVS